MPSVANISFFSVLAVLALSSTARASPNYENPCLELSLLCPAVTKEQSTVYVTETTTATTIEITTAFTTAITTATTTATTTAITTSTVTASCSAPPPQSYCIPATGNRVVNPGFETTTAWVLGPGTDIQTIAPNSPVDRNVLVANFIAPGQTLAFYQTIFGICRGKTYNFKAEIQLLSGAGNAIAEFYLGNVLILRSSRLTQGAWVTVRGTVVASSYEQNLRVDVVSGGAAGNMRFLLDDFELQVV